MLIKTNKNGNPVKVAKRVTDIPVAWIYYSLYHFIASMKDTGNISCEGIHDKETFINKYNIVMDIYKDTVATETENVTKNAFDEVINSMGYDEYFDYILPTVSYRVFKCRHHTGVVVLSEWVMPYTNNE